MAVVVVYWADQRRLYDVLFSFGQRGLSLRLECYVRTLRMGLVDM